MPDIKDSVGQGLTNNTHDVALVQLMLEVVKDSKNQPYLAAGYDGSFGGVTKNAIVAFQNDQGLLKVAKPENAGEVTSGGATVQKLTAMLPAAYANIRALPGAALVYIEDDAKNAAKSQADVAADPGLDPTFRANIAKLVDQMYQAHKVSLWVAPKGGRRTFAEQAAIPPANTGAGPGESNHNYGQAVDIGFKDFQWVDAKGAIHRSDYWLNDLSKTSSAKAQALWEVRNKVATSPAVGVFPTTFKGDLIHLQGFDDSNVSMRRSLAALLTTVTGMTWTALPQSQYSVKFGAKAVFTVGTAREIWAGNAAVTPDVAAEWESVQQKKVVTAKQITQKEIGEVKTAIKGYLQSAETNFSKWKPVP